MFAVFLICLKNIIKTIRECFDNNFIKMFLKFNFFTLKNVVKHILKILGWMCRHKTSLKLKNNMNTFSTTCDNT